ncbi:carboxypeptidase-like regulatory domain-containing protein [Aquimarina sp. RZ0]|uniref:TonB-dependent receptor n=1 Tax=Aquimarina sp. RZ0 TaxID=2607730 RepID=UPI0011F35BC8|nr:carboxypeptidase-like regulatory domain-containing protein [Aquimarina sp. RZ0]KAA1244982.1 TonB-dependent receptor [Aquimarina sp. RZ0]
MIRYILFFFFCIQIVTAQENESLISISYDTSDLESILYQIEEKTTYTFYFQKSWLTPYQNISGNHQDITIKALLEDLLKNTVLNFHVLDKNAIILSPNTIIYDKLPEGFFGKDPENDTSVTKINKNISPVFRNHKKSPNIQTIRIGKASEKTSGQSFALSGNIKNLQTNKPIANAIIVVNGNDAGIKSSSKGFYEIQLTAGTYLIEVVSERMERQKKRVIIYNKGSLDFNLIENIQLLDEVILNAEAKKNIEDVVTKITVDVEESKNIPLVLGERDVLKVAASIPGITTAGEGALGYNVRGGKSDQNLILLDDAVVYNPQHFFGIFSALNPFAIGDVSIYKNGIPASYGGRLSSVFDLKTKSANINKFKGEASIGPITGNLLLETPIVKGKSGLMIGGRAAYANWVLNSLDEESLKNSEASFYDAIAKYNHQISKKSKIEATAYVSRDDFSITSDSLYIYNNRALSLIWKYRFNDKNTGKIAITNSEYTFDIEFDGQSDDDFKLGYRINETLLKLQFKYNYSDRLKFDYGLSSKLYTVEPGEILPINESILTPRTIEKERGLESAAFLSGKMDLNKKLTFDAGIRFSVFNTLGEGTQNIYEDGVPRDESTIRETLSFDKNEVIKTYGGPEYRISGRYLLGQDFSLKAAYNKTFQYIHVLSNNTTASPVDTWKLSDLNIKPQSAQQYSLGLYKNLDDAAYEVSLEGFYKKSKNILDFKTGADILLNENIETEVLQGNGKSYGVEFLLKKQKGKLYGWLGYTYARSLIQLDSPFNEERVNGGNFFPSNFDKPHDFSLVTNYKFTKRFSLSTNFVYQTGRPVTVPIGNFDFNDSEFTVFSNRNEFRIPDFYRLDIGLNIEGTHKRKKLAHSFVTISVYNVLGRNNPLSVFFVTTDGEVKAFQSSIFSVPVPSITYNFKF